MTIQDFLSQDLLSDERWLLIAGIIGGLVILQAVINNSDWLGWRATVFLRNHPFVCFLPGILIILLCIVSFILLGWLKAVMHLLYMLIFVFVVKTISELR